MTSHTAHSHIPPTRTSVFRPVRMLRADRVGSLDEKKKKQKNKAQQRNNVRVEIK